MCIRRNRVLLSLILGSVLVVGPASAELWPVDRESPGPTARRTAVVEVLTGIWERLRAIWLADGTGQPPVPAGDEGASLDPNGTPSMQGDEGASLDPNG